ncbi:uncharacterized protein LOC132187875 [Corylus avellana]|uniref:uncharacterized protein LOC132187875 n=1 Tax=Corylus avellana TaxID=13451 RepID=UPI00286A3D61|nr:uncharacterized protein LOC132187875 [Corylus avellana]
MGVIIRNHEGDILAAKCFYSRGCLKPTDAKALAAMEATQICCELGYDWIKFVGDVKLIVEAVNSDEQDWSKKGHIIDAIHSSVRTFSHWTFSHVNGEANWVAHELATLATTPNKDELWFSDPPTCIQKLIVSKKSVLPT